MHFEVLREDPHSAARLGRLHTPHGIVETPAFMPVGTYGTVKGLRAEDLEALGAQIMLCNAYHLEERPGSATIQALGGLHAFTGWPGPILTDSGGYQVMSLANRRRVDDDGVTFRSPLDGQARRLTPESVVAIQARLGVDVAMVLDECVASPADRITAERAVARSQSWAERSRPLAEDLTGGLFAIVQGSVYADLRATHARRLAALDFDGYAIGGLSVGEDKESTWVSLEAAVAELPAGRPRYVMGMGLPADLVDGVRRGVDLFDCVIPTRHARNGMAFTADGTLVIRHARYANDPAPLDPGCACPACARYSRAYIRHLKLRKEILASVLMTVHNVWHYLDTMRRVRQSLASGATVEMRRQTAPSGSRSGKA